MVVVVVMVVLVVMTYVGMVATQVVVVEALRWIERKKQ